MHGVKIFNVECGNRNAEYRTEATVSVLGSPVQGELDFCALRAQKD